MSFSLSSNLGVSSPPVVWWARPTDWLPLPSIGNSEQKLVGLVAIFDTDTNAIALNAAGNYTVNWGDGTVENFTSGTTAEHLYTYSTISNTTLCSRGYKQVIITITPQSGHNLTSIDVHRKHSIYGAGSQVPLSGWLDITINASMLTSLIVGRIGTLCNLLVESINITAHNFTSMANMFQGLLNLQSVSVADTANVTIMTSTFSSCINLKYGPLLNTANVTNINGMFSSNTSLLYLPTYDFSKVTNCSNFITTVSRLAIIPAFNFAAVTTSSTFTSNPYGLIRCLAYGFTRSISFANGNLSAVAINEIFANLGIAAGAQTITVTGNRGAASCNTLTATTKGWTVVV